MAEDRKVIRPDLDFVRAIRASGGDTVKQCMQCANCSVACELSPVDRPFPRKEMILAGWGQKEELVDPDIWLCFGCTDCSIQCPRGARPGDVMAAVRKEAIRRFSPFGGMQKALESPKWLPLLIAVPVLLWGTIYMLFRDPAGRESYFDGIFPPGILEPVLGAMTMLGMGLFAIGALRYWKALVAAHPAPAGANLVGSIIKAVTDVMTHAKFRKCEEGGTRAIGHMLMFYGFTLIFIGGSIVGAGFMFHLLQLPLEKNGIIGILLKVVMNIGAVGLILGTFILLWYRRTRPERQMQATYYDWFFLVVLFVTGVTGLLTELFRWLAPIEVAFAVYFIHLVCVFCLLGYAPWSKIAHLVYRTVAMVHAAYVGREAPLPAAAKSPDPEPQPQA
jgi:quinone-modifying oxidoreductase, subunit QmoC